MNIAEKIAKVFHEDRGTLFQNVGAYSLDDIEFALGLAMNPVHVALSDFGRHIEIDCGCGWATNPTNTTNQPFASLAEAQEAYPSARLCRHLL